jgi:sugar/nucleoside kinase (ribokinase family)
VATRCAEEDVEVTLRPLRETGVPVTWSAAERTTAFSFRYEEERRVMAVEAIGPAWSGEDVESWAAPALEGAAWAHVGALLRSDFGPEAISALAAGGRKLLVDAQGLLRRAALGPLQRDGDIDPGVLAPIQALKLSESEARVLAGGTDVAALRSLGVPEVVLTLGSSGSLVVAGALAEHVAAEPVDVADPTGAGDSYALGYAAARVAGADPVEAARSASDLVTHLLRGRT